MSAELETLEAPYTIPTWTLGDRLRKARTDADLTLEELSAAIGGKSPATIGNWETGRHAPSLQDVELIAETTRVALWWLLGFQANPGRKAILEARIRNRWFRQLDLGFLTNVSLDRVS